MTRDEAKFKLLEATDNKCTERWMEDLLDSLGALGVLQFEEKRGPNEKAIDAILAKAEDLGGLIVTPRHVVEAINAAGLTIVETANIEAHWADAKVTR